MKPTITFITFSLLVSFSYSAHSALNKWVDSQGKVHYSDTPPVDTKPTAVPNFAGKSQTEAPATYSTKSYAERETELKKARQTKSEAADKKAKLDANAEIKKKNCAAAQQNLRALEEGTRIMTYDANGERAYMDDEARAKGIADARNSISSNCN